MNEYTKMANDFAEKHGVTLKVLDSEYRQFWGEQQPRWVFKLCLRRNEESYTFKFRQSIATGSAEPEMYDVLACLVKYDPEDFKTFCDSFGVISEQRYILVCREWDAVKELFGDVLDELRDIY